MKTDSTGIAARMMLSLDRGANLRMPAQSSPAAVHTPAGSLSAGSQGCPWYHERTAFSFRL